MNTLQTVCFQFKENDEASKECIRIMNDRYISLFNMNREFTGKAGHYYFLVGDKRDWQYTIPNMILVTAKDYLTLLTGKQLTERERQRDVIKDLLPTQESVESQPESKQGVCLECGKPLVSPNSFGYHNHCSEIAHASQPEIVPVQEESRGIPMPSNEWFKEMRIKITKELFPESTQEVKWLISTEEIEAFIKSYSPFGTKTVGNWNFQQQLQVFINERISQQTAHFQQQLKEAKELLIELESYLDDEVAIVQAAVSSDNYACINDAQLPSLYLKINQFLTRNK